jgi:hypothetical protein
MKIAAENLESLSVAKMQVCPYMVKMIMAVIIPVVNGIGCFFKRCQVTAAFP